MQDNANSELPVPKRIPWNKGKLTGAKPALRQKHVWAIRTKLQIDQRPRDLAITSLVALRISAVTPVSHCGRALAYAALSSSGRCSM